MIMQFQATSSYLEGARNVVKDWFYRKAGFYLLRTEFLP